MKQNEPVMNQAQFDLITKLFRVPLNSSSREVLRRILVEGMDKKEANDVGISRQAVHDGIKRYVTTYSEICSIFQEEKQHGKDRVLQRGKLKK